MRSAYPLAAALVAVALCPACGKKKDAPKTVVKATEISAKPEKTGKSQVDPAAAASPTDADKAPAPAKPAAPADQAFSGVPRTEFNRLAAELYLPLFWREDSNKDGAINPGELAALWGYGKPEHRNEGQWQGGGRLTQHFEAAHAAILARYKGGEPPQLPGPEGERQATVRKELSQGRPTLIRTTFDAGKPYDRKLVQVLMQAATLVEGLHAAQRGTTGMAEQLPPEDTASRMLIYRNQGPWCVAPKTEKDPDCSAMLGKPPRISGLYPAELQGDEEFCDKLAARKDAKPLMHHFHVVRGKGSKLKAVPYHVAWSGEMRAVSDLLKEAAGLLETDKSEEAFLRYLLAAAKAFVDGSWPDADEAWSKMNARNSRWYLRIGPDEVYFEPCSRKAGFHVSFARINQDSLRWQDKLDPLKGQMEDAIAALAGPPYKARKVSFHLPDFIDIVLNAGDSRSPHGATIGQSLPNWGPVANEGRGRTVAMTNLYTDPDSVASFKEQAESLICAESLKTITWDQEPSVMSTVLHEAAHNLGPAHEYKVDGKTDDELFGGPLASTMEELKAQTAAMWLNGWLASKGKIDTGLSHSGWGRDVLWAFGHISRGMYNARGKPKPYSQLAAIQLGYLMQEGVMQWRADEKAPNGADTGCFALDYGKFGPVGEKLMTKVAGIKSRGDKDGALELRKRFVDADNDWKKLRDTVTERWLRSPKATFVYSIDGVAG